MCIIEFIAPHYPQRKVTALHLRPSSPVSKEALHPLSSVNSCWSPKILNVLCRLSTTRMRRRFNGNNLEAYHGAWAKRGDDRSRRSSAMGSDHSSHSRSSIEQKG